MSDVLIITAHEDDEVLGCGGFISRFSDKSYAVAFLSRGEFNRDAKKRARHAVNAAKVLGIDKTFFFEHPNVKMNAEPEIDITRDVESAIRECQPHTVLTHFGGDVHVDHRAVFNSVIAATRPFRSRVKEVLSFEIPTSSEFGIASFNPDTYYSLSDLQFKNKVRALRQYRDEDPVVLERMIALARYRGSVVGVEYAEAFKTVRRIL